MAPESNHVFQSNGICRPSHVCGGVAGDKAYPAEIIQFQATILPMYPGDNDLPPKFH